jgi:hypothetical protein
MKLVKIVSLVMLAVFAMSSMSLTFAAPITNNNLKLASNSSVTPDSIPDYVELTVKKDEYFSLPYCDNYDYGYSYEYNSNYFNLYNGVESPDIFKAMKEGTRTILVYIGYYDDDDNYNKKVVEYRVTILPNN